MNIEKEIEILESKQDYEWGSVYERRGKLSLLKEIKEHSNQNIDRASSLLWECLHSTGPIEEAPDETLTNKLIALIALGLAHEMV